MGYDQIVSGPEDMLRQQMTEDATVAREAAAANGTNVFQAVRKLQASLDEVQRVVLEQRATFNELEARFSRSLEGPDRNHSVANNNSYEGAYSFTFPPPDVDRYALLSFSMRFTKTGVALAAFAGLDALGMSLFRSVFKTFPDTRIGEPDTAHGTTVPLVVPAGSDLDVNLVYRIDNFSGSGTQTGQVRNVICSIMYGTAVG